MILCSVQGSEKKVKPLHKELYLVSRRNVYQQVTRFEGSTGYEMNAHAFPVHEFYDAERVGAVWRIRYEARARQARERS